MSEETVVSAEAAVETPVETTETVTETPEVPVETTVESSETPVVETPPKKKTAQERIDEITRARRAAERETEYWKRAAMEKAEKPIEPVAEPASIVPPRPVLAQFESTEAYEDALFAWNDKRREIESAAARQRTEQETALRKFNAAARKIREEHEDFDDVVNAPVFSNDMRLILLNSEHGPEVAYHLGRPENRDIADRIRALPSNMQIYELVKLETQLLLAQKARKVTNSPPPITPVGVAGGVEVDESKLSIEEWMALEKKKTLEKLKAKYG